MNKMEMKSKRRKYLYKELREIAVYSVLLAGMLWIYDVFGIWEDMSQWLIVKYLFMPLVELPVVLFNMLIYHPFVSFGLYLYLYFLYKFAKWQNKQFKRQLEEGVWAVPFWW